MKIKQNGIAIKYDDDIKGFKLETIFSVQKDTNVLQVPRKAILSWDVARKSPMLKFVFYFILYLRIVLVGFS